MTQAPHREGLVIAVLAGGRSRRLGFDKASMVLDGETLLARTVRLAQLFAPVAVVGRPAPADWGHSSTLFLSDELGPGHGPLAGLVSALDHFRQSVLLLACDMPKLEPSAIAWLIAQWRGPETAGVMACQQEWAEPLLAIYGTSCLALARQRLSAAVPGSLWELARDAGLDRAALPAEGSQWVANLNVPEDLQALGLPPPNAGAKRAP
jgi:molybdopterin-guanine dinucleotide biosynthesis protein A